MFRRMDILVNHRSMRTTDAYMNPKMMTKMGPKQDPKWDRNWFQIAQIGAQNMGPPSPESALPWAAPGPDMLDTQAFH